MIKQTGPLVSDNVYLECNGTDRNLYLTVTRTRTSIADNEGEHLAESRLLQGAPLTNITFTFFTSKGDYAPPQP